MFKRYPIHLYCLALITKLLLLLSGTINTHLLHYSESLFVECFSKQLKKIVTEAVNNILKRQSYRVIYIYI